MNEKLRVIIEAYEREHADPELFNACKMLERMQEVESRGGKASSVLAEWISERVLTKLLTDGDE